VSFGRNNNWVGIEKTTSTLFYHIISRWEMGFRLACLPALGQWGRMGSPPPPQKAQPHRRAAQGIGSSSPQSATNAVALRSCALALALRTTAESPVPPRRPLGGMRANAFKINGL